LAFWWGADVLTGQLNGISLQKSYEKAPNYVLKDIFGKTCVTGYALMGPAPSARKGQVFQYFTLEGLAHLPHGTYILELDGEKSIVGW
jgi:hypothetical protein